MAEVWARIMATDHARAVRHLEVDDEPYSLAKTVVGLTSRGERGREDFKALVRDAAFEYANQVAVDYRVFKDAMKPSGCKDVV